MYVCAGASVFVCDCDCAISADRMERKLGGELCVCAGASVFVCDCDCAFSADRMERRMECGTQVSCVCLQVCVYVCVCAQVFVCISCRPAFLTWSRES